MRKNYEAQKSMKNMQYIFPNCTKLLVQMTNISVVFPIFLHTFKFDHLQFAAHVLPVLYTCFAAHVLHMYLCFVVSDLL